MLCRVLFVAAVVSYVLCVLLLSGVQKEDLDATTLRKLQRHNVNIDAIGDRKLQSQCLTEKNLATPLSTRRDADERAKTSTMKPIILEVDSESTGSPSQWKKLFALFKQKKQNSSNLKETTMQSLVLPSDSNTDTSPSMQNRFVENIIGKVTKAPQNTVINNEKKNAHYNSHNPDKTQPGSSTAKDNIIAERSNDVEYISKIVAEILSQRQPKPVEASTVLPVRTFNTNKLVEDIDKILKETKRNEAHFRTNYSSNNTTASEKQENSPDEYGSNKEEKDIIEDFLNQLSNTEIQAVTNLRKSFLNNIQTDLEEGKITLYNARDKLSDMLSITKNEPNSWLYVVDSHGIKPITTRPLADQKEDLFNQLSDSDKAIICKMNNEMRFIQKEIYRFVCPYERSSKLTEAMPEERNNIQFDRPNERDSKSVGENHQYPNDSKNVWPYFVENQNNINEKMERNSLHIMPPSDHYETMKSHDLGVDDEYKSKWPYYRERQRNTEQQYLNRENTNLILNQLNYREKTTNGINELDRDKIKTFEKPLSPIGFANQPNGDRHYNTEWAFNIGSTKELEHKQENPIFIRPKADEKIPNPSYPSFNGEFKNTWPYYFENMRATQNANLEDNKNALHQIPPDREMLLNNPAQILLENERLVSNRLDKSEKTANSRDIIDPKSINWYGMKEHDTIDNNSTGTLGYYNVRDAHKNSIREETTNIRNNISPNYYETINWPSFIERYKTQHEPITTEGMQNEPLYTINREIPKHNDYNLAKKDEAYNKLLMNAETRSNQYQKSKSELNIEDSEKVKSLPPEVIKEIADTVKQIVLKDLKTEKSATPTTETTITTTTATPFTTTTIEPITTAIITTSITSTTTTAPITIKTTAEVKTTYDKPSTTEKEDNMKIQEASRALKDFMELFEKFNQMKNGNLNPNITQTRGIVTQTQRAIAISTVPTMVRNPYASYKIATAPTLIHNPYAPYKFYAPLLPPMSPYGNQSPYLQSKAIVLDPYLQKIIQIPATIHNNAVDNAHSVGRSAQALTFQTNSNEIKPLKVPVSKAMIVDNIVVSPKPPRGRGRHLREYSDEIYRYRKPTKKKEYNVRSNRSRDIKFEGRPRPRSMKKDYSYNDRYYKPQPNYEGVRFHEKLEKEDNWPRSSVEGKCGSKEICNERIAARQQRPLINIASTYDDTHFRNFLKTQQKVNDMLERILATKTKSNHRSSEVI